MQTTTGKSEATLHLARSGYRSTLVAQFIKLACKLGGVICLARLVSPAEHGLFAMAASLLSFLVLFRDLGTNIAAIQISELSPGQATALWHLQGGLGVALAGSTVALAPLWKSFFHDERLPQLLVVTGASFIMAGFSGWPRISLHRELRFDEINRIEVAGSVAGTLAMVTIAFFGGGVYALVSFPLASESAMLITAWLRCTSRPTAPADWKGLGSLLRAGLGLTGYNVLLYPLQQMDTLLIGRWFGAHTLGLYNRAGQLLMQPTTHLAAPFGEVLLSSLARLGPESPAFRPHLRSTINTIAHFTLPFVALCVAMPDDVISVALGGSWAESAELLRWLAISAATSFVSATIYPLCVTTGKATRLIGMTAATLIVTAAMLFLARHHGATGVTRALAAANVLLVLPRIWWSTRGTPVSLSDYRQALSGPVWTAAALGIGMVAGQKIWGEYPGFLRMNVGAAGGALAVLVIAMMKPELRAEFHSVRKNLPFTRKAG